MKTEYVYVDGENVNLEVVEQYLERLNLHPSKYLGKLYGSKDIIGSSVGKYLLKGFSYIETSTLSTNKKNLADMKIVVDCIADICLCGEQDIHVHILSNDSDFLPLIYKLRELGVQADTLSIDKASACEITQTTLYEELNRRNFFPVEGERVWGILYDELYKVLPEDFPSDVVEDYVKLRISKLVKELEQNNLGHVADVVRKFPVAKFSLENYMSLFKGVNKDTYYALVTMFTRKVFGITLRSKDIDRKIN